MKKLTLTSLFLIGLLNFSFSQNSFPSTGPVSIGTTSTSFLLNIGSSSNRGTIAVIGSTTSAPTIGLTDSRTSGGSFSLYSGLSAVGNFDIFDQVASAYRLTIKPSGNVGIGITTPLGLLSLNNQIENTSNSNNPVNYAATDGVIGQAIINSYYVLNSDGNGPYPRYLDIASIGSPDGTNGGGNIRFLTNPIVTSSPAVERMRVTSSGNVLIGKTSQMNTAYILDVNGNIRGNEVVVNTSGADFVFNPSYRLNSLSYLKKYIDQNHHLPEIPSAIQMQKQGLNVGENQVKLLQKVEELTLYLIEKDKQISAQQVQIKQMKQQIAAIAKQLNHKN